MSLGSTTNANEQASLASLHDAPTDLKNSVHHSTHTHTASYTMWLFHGCLSS